MSKEKILQIFESVLKDTHDVNETPFETIGLGQVTKQKNQTMFLIVDWPQANEARRRLKLEPKQFHATIGFRTSDIHDVDKGPNSLIVDEESVNALAETMDKVSLT